MEELKIRGLEYFYAFIQVYDEYKDVVLRKDKCDAEIYGEFCQILAEQGVCVQQIQKWSENARITAKMDPQKIMSLASTIKARRKDKDPYIEAMTQYISNKNFNAIEGALNEMDCFELRAYYTKLPSL